jgi:quinol monooxygenase YgiN
MEDDYPFAGANGIRLLEGEKYLSVFALLKMVTSPKKRTEFLQTLKTLRYSTCQPDSGCIGYRVFQEGENENSIILILEWQTQENLIAFRNSDQYKILSGAISLLCESSEITTGSGQPDTLSLANGRGIHEGDSG